MIKIETVDAALFLYPEFVAKARSLETAGKGMSPIPPSTNRPGSTVEKIVMDRQNAQNVVDAIDSAIATLDDDLRAILTVKYGWRWDNDRLIISEPVGTKQTFDLLCQMDAFHWCESYYYDALEELRKRVGAYLDSLGRLLYAAFGMMPRKRKKARKVSDEEFKEIEEYLKKKRVNFTANRDEKLVKEGQKPLDNRTV